MSNKLLLTVIIIVLFTGLFTTVVYAKSSNLLSFKKHKMIITLKDEADINVSKDKISKIHQVKIINIKDRNKEWSKMVNKMDLPNMENPFKNEFIISINKNANINEIYNQIETMDFVENIQYVPDTGRMEKQK